MVYPPKVPGVENAIDIHCHAHEGQQDDKNKDDENNTLARFARWGRERDFTFNFGFVSLYFLPHKVYPDLFKPVAGPCQRQVLISETPAKDLSFPSAYRSSHPSG